MEVRFWSRRPGKFVDRRTGQSIAGPSFTGTVREWYETLIEHVIDLKETVEDDTKNLQLVVDERVNAIIQCSALWHFDLLSSGRDGVLELMSYGRIPTRMDPSLEAPTCSLYDGDRLLGSVQVLDMDII